MNVLEAEIAKYERRLEKIERDPSPSMLASNKLFYQAQLDDCREQLKAWREGKPFLGVATHQTQLMRCFGDFQILNMVRLADRLGTGRAEASVDRVRAMGLPEYACDRTILFMPMAFMGDDLPKPKLIVASTGFCNVVHDTHRTLAYLLNVPLFTVDVPFEDPYQDHLGYTVKQLEELVDWVEATLPGAKFDEGKLVRLQQYDRRWRAALHEIYELRKNVPSPEHPRDVFREPMYPGHLSDPSLIVKYYESYRDELRERVKKGRSPIGEEKLRILWTISGPYGSNVWDYLAGRGVSVPYWYYGGAASIFILPNHGDVSEYGRELTPLEEEARVMMYNSWGGSGERWVRDIISASREFQVDGVVLFEQTGCQPVLGLGQPVIEALEKEFAIPVWRVEGRQLLGRSERVEAEFMAGLEAFVNLCFDRKGGR